MGKAFEDLNEYIFQNISDPKLEALMDKAAWEMDEAERELDELRSEDNRGVMKWF
jgi:hypothetical protein